MKYLAKDIYFSINLCPTAIILFALVDRPDVNVNNNNFEWIANSYRKYNLPDAVYNNYVLWKKL